MSDPRNARHRISIKFIFRSQNKILIQRGTKKYHLLGGGVDLGENISDTMKREFFEETGLSWRDDFSPILVDAQISQFTDNSIFDAVANLMYLIDVKEPFTITPEATIIEYRWVNHQELSELSMSDHSNKELLLHIISQTIL